MTNTNAPLTRNVRDIEKPFAYSAEEALDKGKLNWIAEEQALITAGGINIDSHKAIVRSDNRQPIGIVGKGYGVVQNVEAFAIADALIKEKEGYFTRAGFFDGGSKVYLEAFLPGQDEVKKGDIIGRRISFFNSFDGSSGVKGRYNPLRLVCLNGMRTALDGEAFSIRHSRAASDRVREAMRVWAGAEVYFENVKLAAQQLAQKIVDKAMIEKFLMETFEIKSEEKAEGLSTRRLNQVRQVQRLYKHGQGNEGRTAWDLYNGLTEYVDHYQFESRDEDERMATIMVGSAGRMKERAFESAMRL